jgi:hypothetical protein
MSRKHLPAAVLVSIGCSVALSEAPLAGSNDVLKVSRTGTAAAIALIVDCEK